MSEHMSPIPSRLYNAAVGGHVCGPEDLDFGQKVIHLVKYDRAGNEVSFESQVTQANKIYVIHDDFTLSSNVTIPANCTLQFEGGSISGAYTITGNNTGIQAGLVKIFNTNVTLAGTWNITEVYPEWFGAKGDGVTDDTLYIQKCVIISNAIRRTAILSQIYKVTSTIDIPSYTVIKGTTFWNSNNQSNLPKIISYTEGVLLNCSTDNDSVKKTHIRIENVELYSALSTNNNNSIIPQEGTIGIDFCRCVYARFIGVNIFAFEYGMKGYTGNSANTVAWDNFIEHAIIHYCKYGITASGNNVNISNSRVSVNSYNLSFYYVNGLSVRSVDAEGGNGIYCNVVTGGFIQNIGWENNAEIEGAVPSAIHIENSSCITICGCTYTSFMEGTNVVDIFASRSITIENLRCEVSGNSPKNAVAIKVQSTQGLNIIGGIFRAIITAIYLVKQNSGTILYPTFNDPITNKIRMDDNTNRMVIGAYDTIIQGLPNTYKDRCYVIPDLLTGALYGDSTKRPLGVQIGFRYFDQSLGIPIYWNGTKWIKADGTDA